jgi:alkylhydroperoxidase/carboxymuconolactone decarboxylase family protein YurZ
MSETLSKAQLLDNLRALLMDVFKLRREGAAYAKLSRAHGYVDGYMRSLLENGAASRQELLELVAAVRVSADGPATATVTVEEEVAA